MLAKEKILLVLSQAQPGWDNRAKHIPSHMDTTALPQGLLLTSTDQWYRSDLGLLRQGAGVNVSMGLGNYKE